MTDDSNPWGTTATSALRWAYNSLVKSNVPPGTLGQELTATKARHSGLSRVDLRASAALIRKIVDEEISALGKAIITAVYLPSPTVERRPGGGPAQILDRFGNDRGKAIQSVAYHVMSTKRSATPRPRGGYDELVAQYAINQINNDRLCKLLRLRREQANEVRKELYEQLHTIQAQAEAEVEVRMRDKGWL